MLQRLDDRVLRAMRTRWHSPAGEAIGIALGKAGNNGAIWAVLGAALAVIAAINGGRWEEWLAAGLLAPIAIVLNYAIKVLVRRPRPILEGLPPLGGAPSSLSFPSAHAASSFAAATLMTRIAPEAAVAFVLAIAIAACRPYLGMHYPSDVLAGTLLGVALGLLFPLGAIS